MKPLNFMPTHRNKTRGKTQDVRLVPKRDGTYEFRVLVQRADGVYRTMKKDHFERTYVAYDFGDTDCSYEWEWDGANGMVLWCQKHHSESTFEAYELPPQLAPADIHLLCQAQADEAYWRNHDVPKKTSVV